MKEKTRTFGIKRIICLTLMLLLVLGVAGSVAILSEVQADAVNVSTVDKFITEVTAGNNVTLTADISLQTKITTKTSQTINLNGHRLSISTNSAANKDGGFLVTSGRLTISSSVAGSSIKFDNVSEPGFDVSGGDLTISGTSGAPMTLTGRGTKAGQNFIVCHSNRSASAPGSVILSYLNASGFNDINYGDGGFLDYGSADSTTKNWYTKITSCSFSDCTATYGAVIAVSSNTDGIEIYITGSTFSNNDAKILDNQPTANGGAINYASTGSASTNKLTLNKCIFSDNTAGNIGGAVCMSAGKGTLTVSSCTFTGNKTTSTGEISSGGAIYLKNATATFSGTNTFESNEASKFGGAIFVAASTVTAGSDTIFQDNSAETGGAMYGTAANITIEGSTFGGAKGNVARGGNGGAIFVTNSSNLSIGSDVSITYNAASLSGGAIYAYNSNLTFDSGNISNNQCYGASSYGGAIAFAVNDGKTHTFNYNGGTIANNSSNKGYAGGIANRGGVLNIGGTVTTNVVVQGNTAATLAGGIYNNGTLTFHGGAVTSNNAPQGAGIYNSGTMTVNAGSSISSNSSSGNAAGIFNDGTLTITGGNIAKNAATTFGGGIVNSSNGTLTISGGTISANTAVNFGAGVYQNGTMNVSGTVVISGNTVNSSANNLFLPSGKTFKINNTLASTAKIGVTASAMSTTSGPIQIVTAGSVSNTGTYQQKKTITIASATSALTNGLGYVFSDNTAFFSGIGLKTDTTNAATASLYDNWTLSFNANSGTVSPASKDVIYGMAVGILPTPSRTGYEFLGWYTAATGGTSYTSATTYKVVGNTTLYAHWKAIEYKITYYMVRNNDDPVKFTNPAPSVYTINDAVTLAELPVLPGYAKSGWYLTPACTGATVSALSKGSYGTKNLYVKYTANNYTLNFNANGGITPDPESKTVTYDVAVGALATTTRPGCTFAGWWTAIEGGTEYTSTTIFKSKSNVTLYAHWTAIEYEIHYYKVVDDDDPEEITGQAPSTYTINDAVTLAELPVLPGYSQTGWYLTSACTGATVDALSKGSYGTKNLYVKYTKSSGNYTLTFDANKGTTPVPETKTVIYGVKVGTLPTTTRTGYTFKGWFTAKTGGTEYTVDTVYEVEANTTLYAHWIIGNGSTQFNATFENDGAIGTVPDAIIRAEGEKFDIPAAELTKPGYKHIGWTLKGGDGTLYVPGQEYIMPGANIVFTPVFAKTPLKVTFDPNGGACQTEFINLEWGDEYGKNGTLPTATRIGYTFSGWFTAAIGGEQITDTTKVTQINDHTLYAHWTAKIFVVAFNAQGGTGTMADQNFVYNDNQILRENEFTAPTGKVFAGWSKYANTTSTDFADKQMINASDLSDCTGDPATKITLYAVWEDPDVSLIKEPYKDEIRVKLDVINAFTSMHLGYDAGRNEYASHTTTFDLSALLVDGAGTLNWVVTDERGLGTTSYLTVSGNTVTISYSGYYKCVGTATDNRTCTIYVYAPGDVNADSQVTGYDAAKISRHNGGFEKITDAIAILMADTNNDWIISSYDWNNIINDNTKKDPLSVPQNAQAERTAIYAVLSDSKFSI